MVRRATKKFHGVVCLSFRTGQVTNWGPSVRHPPRPCCRFGVGAQQSKNPLIKKKRLFLPPPLLASMYILSRKSSKEMVQLTMTHPFPKKKPQKRPMTGLESFDYIYIYGVHTLESLQTCRLETKWITVSHSG